MSGIVPMNIGGDHLRLSVHVVFAMQSLCRIGRHLLEKQNKNRKWFIVRYLQG